MLCWRNDIKTKRTHVFCPLSCYLFRSPLIHIVEYVNIYAIQTLYRHKWFILPATLWQCQYLLYAYMKWNETFKIFALAFICLARKCKSVLQVSILLLYIFFFSPTQIYLPYMIDEFILCKAYVTHSATGERKRAE